MDEETKLKSLKRRDFFRKTGNLAKGSLLFTGLSTAIDAKEKALLNVPLWSRTLGLPTAKELYG